MMTANAQVSEDHVDPAVALQIPAPPTRRELIAGGLGGLVGLVAAALGRPAPAAAAAGDPLLIGNTANNAGTSNTTLTTSSTGTALLVTQNGSGTAIRGSAVGANSIAGFFTAANGTGISGVTGTGSTYGVFGQNNGPASTAGAIRAAGGNNHGLVATTANAAKAAVTASNTGGAGSGAAVVASGGSNHGVDASTNNGARYGVKAVNNGGGVGLYSEAPSNVGVQGVSSSSVGVLGSSSSHIGVQGSTSSSVGVYGTSDGYIGVQGNGGGLAGVYGQSAWQYGAGVYGRGMGDSGHGVVGTIDFNTSTAAAIYGEAAAGNPSFSYAAYLVGNAVVTGGLSKGGGSFRIDHPLDPANKILQHSFVESPDMLNIYNGVVRADANGEATVALPDWFMALNRDFRYGLTPIGEFAPLYVKSKVAKGRFTIAGAKAGQEVSWQLTGIRQDAWANANRIEVELDKPAAQRGLYLHPREHGKPDSKGVDDAARQRIARAREATRSGAGPA